MTFNKDGLVIEPIMVTVALEKYEELLRKAEHYDNIVDAVFESATLSSWRKDELELDTSTIERYLLIVEAARARGTKHLLRVKREALVDDNTAEVQA